MSIGRVPAQEALWEAIRGWQNADQTDGAECVQRIDRIFLDAIANARRAQSFRAGDHVKHHPSGESWVLACDEENGRVQPAGWPESQAEAAHCSLKREATDEQRLKQLRESANISTRDGGDARQRVATRQLETES